MFRVAVASLLLASTEASRIQVHEASETKWGSSCDDLQSLFHDRVTAFQETLGGVDEQSGLSTGAQTRLTFGMYRITRTLRRARECDWVVENNSEDLEQMRGAVQQLLAGNPCAEAAGSEMEQGTANDDAQSIPRAISILLSDDCEVAADVPESATEEPATEEQLREQTEEQLREQEEELQDSLEQLLTADGESGAFVQVDRAQTFRRFMRGVGVLFLMLFLLLACIGAAAAIAAVLVIAVGWLTNPLSSVAWHSVLEFGVLGAAVGLVACANQLYTNLLPRVTQ